MQKIVRALAAAERLDLDSMTLLQGDLSANAIVIEADGRIYKVECAAPLFPSREEVMWRHARRAGITTPALQRRGVIEGRRFLAYKKLQGTSPSPSHRSLVSAGVALERLHSLSAVGRYPVTQRACSRRLRRFDIALRGRVADGLVRQRSYAASIIAAGNDWTNVRGVATHGDYRCANLLVIDGVLSGVIDWSDGRVASREADLGGVDPVAIPLVLEGYLLSTKSIDLRLVRGYALARLFALAESNVIELNDLIDGVHIVDEILA